MLFSPNVLHTKLVMAVGSLSGLTACSADATCHHMSQTRHGDAVESFCSSLTCSMNDTSKLHLSMHNERSGKKRLSTLCITG